MAKCVAELAKLSLAHGLSSNSRTHVFIFFLELMGEDDIHPNHFKKKKKYGIVIIWDPKKPNINPKPKYSRVQICFLRHFEGKKKLI